MDDFDQMNGWGALIFSALFVALLGAAAFLFHAPGLLALAVLTAGLGNLSYVAILMNGRRAAGSLSLLSWIAGIAGAVLLLLRWLGL